jgi:MerR family transcriptional regulator/heat shock protein HspR
MLNELTMENKSLNKNEPIYPIGVASKLLGISVHTLRMYEKEGLIITARGTNQKNRLYSIADIERMECIRDAITKKKYSIPSIKTMLSLIPCWKIINCREEERMNCPAYNSIGTPCWAYDHKDNICAIKKCRECKVYNDFTNCDDIKKLLKEI